MKKITKARLQFLLGSIGVGARIVKAEGGEYYLDCGSGASLPLWPNEVEILVDNHLIHCPFELEGYVLSSGGLQLYVALGSTAK